MISAHGMCREIVQRWPVFPASVFCARTRKEILNGDSRAMTRHHASGRSCSDPLSRHGKNTPADSDPEHTFPAHIALVADLDQIVKSGTRKGPIDLPHMQIGFEPAGVRLRFETQRVFGGRRSPSHPHWCGNASEARTASRLVISTARNGASSTTIPISHRGDQEILVTFALDHGREEPDQRRLPIGELK